jgi:exodeoxyribonuclease VII small subunit
MSSRRTESAEPGAAAASEGALPFETALARLEALVGELETGSPNLEQALATFEQGVALSRRCAEELERAEQRLEMLVREGGTLVRTRFEPEAD